MFIRVGIFRVVVCEHGPSKGPDDRDEAACAFYEDPENLVPTGPGRKRRPAARVSVAAMWGVFRRFFGGLARAQVFDGLLRRRWRCHRSLWCCQYVDRPMCNSWHDPHLLARWHYRWVSRRIRRAEDGEDAG
jgi:hypothetical protein